MHVHRSGLVQHQLIVFVAMLHRENSKISNNMDCLILQQGTPIIVAMMMREFYICLTMYVEIYRTIFYLFSTYNKLINALYLLYNEHNLIQIQSSL